MPRTARVPLRKHLEPAPMTPMVAPPLRIAPSPPRSLRLAMIWTTSPDDPGGLSGMPFAMAAALRRAGVEIVNVVDAAAPAPTWSARAGQVLPRLAQGPARRVLRWTRIAAEHLRSQGAARAIEQSTMRASRAASATLASLEVDAVFGCCTSAVLAHLDTSLPIIYYSDITARLIFDSYPDMSVRSAAFRRACEAFEQRAMARTSVLAFASHAAAESAVHHYGMPPHRVSCIPMGAHVLPRRVCPITPPSAACVELLIVASDPRRKQLNLAIECAERLRSRGVNARLTVIGPATLRARRSRAVRALGPLRLGRGIDGAIHRGALAESHILLLPSRGEAFGIAPAEAAHFGRPSVVSDAGGLPTVVEHGVTGLVLPSIAGPDVYADTVETLVNDPSKYRSMAAAAQARAQRVLTWDAWAASLLHAATLAGIRRTEDRVASQVEPRAIPFAH